MGQKPKVLVLAKELTFPGGVANFVAMLLGRVGESVDCEHFRIGEPQSGKGGVRKLGWPLIDNLRLSLRLLKGDITCLHMNPSMNWTAFMRDAFLLITARTVGVKRIIVFFHGWDHRFAGQLGRRWFYRFLLQRAYGKASIIIVLARRFKEQLTALGLDSDRILVGTTMFDGAIFSGLDRPKAGQDITMIFMSRMGAEKGVFELLEAFARIKSRQPTVRLMMVGDGPVRRGLEDWVTSHKIADVTFTGYLRGADKGRALLGADLFILPSYYPEGCPVSLLEAMAAGLPCITNDVGGIPDVFQDGRNGILLNGVTVEKLTRAIERMIDDPALRERISRQNRQEAWEKYEVGVVARRIESLYMETSEAKLD